MKYSRVGSSVSSGISRVASLPRSAVLSRAASISCRSALLTYCADLLLALLAVAAVSLLAALATALLSAAPARADVPPTFWYAAPEVGRRENYIGPTQIAVIDEDVKIFIKRSKEYGGDNCRTIRTLLLKNLGNKTYTEQLYVPAVGFYAGRTADNLRVKINGKVAKIDDIPKELDMHTGLPSKYYLVRSTGWPMKFAPGEVIKLEICTTASSIPPGSVNLPLFQGEADNTKNRALVDFKPETVAFWCDYNNEWRRLNSRLRVSFILLDGLTIDNVASMEPQLPTASANTIAFETYGPGKLPENLNLRIRFNITNTELAARYQQLHAKYPNDVLVTTELGKVYESQGLYNKQLKLYQNHIVTHPNPANEFTSSLMVYHGFREFRDAWVKYTERTHNEQNAYIVAPILAKVLGDKDDDWNHSPETLRWFKRYRHSPVQIGSKQIGTKPRATAGSGAVTPGAMKTR